MHGAIPHFSNTPSWRGIQIKRRGNFTFTFTFTIYEVVGGQLSTLIYLWLNPYNVEVATNVAMRNMLKAANCFTYTLQETESFV
jgi:hypothetical protein